MSASSISQMSPQDLKERLDAGENLFLLDVRESWEFDAAKIEGSHLLPLGQLSQRVGEIQKDKDVVVICHHGIRSQHGAQILAASGFDSVYNLSGGIDAWSLRVDPDVPRY